jgi:hypothetical protein
MGCQSIWSQMKVYCSWHKVKGHVCPRYSLFLIMGHLVWKLLAIKKKQKISCRTQREPTNFYRVYLGPCPPRVLRSLGGRLKRLTDLESPTKSTTASTASSSRCTTAEARGQASTFLSQDYISRVARFFSAYIGTLPTSKTGGGEYTKVPQSTHKICQMAIKYSKLPQNYPK